MATYELRTRTTGNKQIPLSTRLIWRTALSTGVKTLYSSANFPAYTMAHTRRIVDEKPVKPWTFKNWSANKAFRYVYNVSSQYEYFEQNVVSWKTRDASFTYTHEWPINYFIGARGICRSLPVNPVITPMALRDAYTKLQPTFKDAKVGDFNIYTAILELADLKQLFVKSTWTLKRAFADLPEKHLLINFAILPLFSDIQAIFDIITKLGSYIDTWNNAALKGVVWDRHVNVLASTNLNSYTTLDAGTLSQSAMLCETKSVVASSKAKAHLYFGPKFIAPEQRNGIYRAAVGLDKPFAGTWEAVPFSWAIDYFSNIGDMIDKWDKALPSLFRYKFVSAGHTQKVTVSTASTFTMRNKPEYGYNLVVPMTPFYLGHKYSYFLRTPVSYASMIDYMERPLDFTLGWNKGWRQASYLASVAYLLTAGRK